MQSYSYKALDKEGKVVKGNIVAGSVDELKQLVAKKDLFYVSSVQRATLGGKKNKVLDNLSIVTLCRQMSSILKAGMPIVYSLELLHGKLEKPKLKKAIEGLYELVQKGNSLSAAMQAQGGTFPPMMVSMVKAGEMSGEIDVTMSNLASHYENAGKTRKQIKSALSYPIILGVVTIVAFFAMMLFILPAMTKSFGDKELPALTAVMMAISNWIKDNAFILIAVVVVVIVGIKLLLKNPEIKLKWDKQKLTLPKLGKLIRMIYTGRFARTLATLYSNGVEFTEAMKMCADIMTNTFAKKQINEAVEKLVKGDSISSAMTGMEAFDPLLFSMLFVGEESGALDEVLLQTADYFDEESSAAIKGITGIIQPVMLCVMAVLIGILLISILQPMMSMYE